MKKTEDWTGKIMRDLVALSRSLKLNDAEITRQYANLAKNHDKYGTFEGLLTADIVALDLIAENSDVNGMLLTEKMGLTKSGVSKILARLLKKELIKPRKLKGDYKSIYYSLTVKGRRAHRLHRKLYSVAKNEMQKIFDGYSEAERKTIGLFVRETTEALDRITKKL